MSKPKENYIVLMQYKSTHIGDWGEDEHRMGVCYTDNEQVFTTRKEAIERAKHLTRDHGDKVVYRVVKITDEF